MGTWQEYLAAHQQRRIEELVQFLRIPSISALPDHAGDVQRAAEWLAARMAKAGIEGARILPTGGHPVVYGEWLHAADKPTVLVYGHFDVQPVDPVDLWSHSPFSPSIDGDRLYARGATDDKGNLMAPILAAEALLSTTGELPINVKFFFEGQEEIGSPQLPAFVTENKPLLACDLVLSADGSQWSETRPTIQLGLRGVCAVQIDVRGADRDLHSGTFGGAVQNPIHALTQILASMRGRDGRILVSGFYDAVASLTDEERQQLASVPYDEAAYMEELGVDQLFGEPGFTTRERTWTRPTLEVNGIWGGFQGEGSKTVLPSDAHAKVTCRLVPDQDPAEIVKRIKAHCAGHTPAGVRVNVSSLGADAKPYTVSANHPGNRAAHSVLKELYGAEPYLTRMGGTIPVCALFKDALRADTVIFAFGLHDERTHAPDEFYRISSFRRAQRAYGMLLERLATEAP